MAVNRSRPIGLEGSSPYATALKGVGIAVAALVPLAVFHQFPKFNPRQVFSTLWRHREQWGFPKMKTGIPGIGTARDQVSQMTRADLVNILTHHSPVDEVDIHKLARLILNKAGGGDKQAVSAISEMAHRTTSDSVLQYLETTTTPLKFKKVTHLGGHSLEVTGEIVKTRTGHEAHILTEGMVNSGRDALSESGTVLRDVVEVHSVKMKIPLDPKTGEPLRVLVELPLVYKDFLSSTPLSDPALAIAGKSIEPIRRFGAGFGKRVYYRLGDIMAPHTLDEIYPADYYSLLHFDPTFFTRWGEFLGPRFKQIGVSPKGNLPRIPLSLSEFRGVAMRGGTTLIREPGVTPPTFSMELIKVAKLPWAPPEGKDTTLHMVCSFAHDRVVLSLEERVGGYITNQGLKVVHYLTQA